ncbi:MAG: nickel-dependent lactate racemase [Gammaproteobacteria bacterium]|nr:nickel-dependent lactate racemase [Gammaproteobacteria bacterium]
MKVELEYGREGLVVELPDELDVRVIRKQPMAVLRDEVRAVHDALAHPNSCAPLGELARGKRSACILICDITRPVPNHLFLQPMIRTLLQAGIPASGITVLVATGLHRPNEGEELAKVVGDPWVLETVTVANHLARDIDAHVDLGRTSRGTPVKLNRRFVDAELRIATGLVEPHFMAGYSGGRKVIAPGVAHEDTIRTLHSARFMEDPLAVQCNLSGNPLHEEQLEIMGMLGSAYALNTVIDENRRLAYVNFGEVVESHLQAVAFAADTCTVAVDRRFKTLVTSSAGYPLDRTYYQTVKAMVTPMDILDAGSNLIVASDCSEGLGSSEFRDAQARLLEHGPEAFLADLLTKAYADIDEWQTEMQIKPMRRSNIHLYTRGLSAADRQLTGVHIADSIESAVAASVTETGDPTVAIIPEGPYVVPKFVGDV